jgi:hypothetical protein
MFGGDSTTAGTIRAEVREYGMPIDQSRPTDRFLLERAHTRCRVTWLSLAVSSRLGATVR